MAITTHPLTPADIQPFREMLALFADAFEDPAHYLGSPPSDAYIADLLASDPFVAIVAREAGAVIGALTAYELKKFARPESEIYIYDLAVAPSHRRQGVATALIARTKAIARQRGASVIFVQADQGDAPPIALYSRLGTRADVLHFDISPDP